MKNNENNEQQIDALDYEFAQLFSANTIKQESIKKFFQENPDYKNAPNVLVEGDNLLHIAAASGAIETVRFLLDHGFDINQENENGKTALEIAKENAPSDLGAALGWANTQEMQDFLEQKKQELNSPDKTDLKGFLDAVRKDDTKSIREYLEAFPGIASKARDDQGSTALHLAVEGERTDLVTILVQEGHSDIYAKNKEGKIPVDLAVTESTLDQYVTDRRAIKRYLDQIDDNLNLLHKDFGSKISETLISATPWLAKLKNDQDVSYEDRKSRKDKALKKVKDIKRASQLKKEAKDSAIIKEAKKSKGKVLEEIKAKAEVTRMAQESGASKHSASAAGEKKTSVEPTESPDKKISKVNKEKILSNIEDAKLKRLLTKKVSKDGSTKLDLLVNGLVAASILADKELAALIAPERRLAEIAKFVLGRKTDNDLVLEVIGKLKETINSIKTEAKPESIVRYPKKKAHQREG